MSGVNIHQNTDQNHQQYSFLILSIATVRSSGRQKIYIRKAFAVSALANYFLKYTIADRPNVHNEIRTHNT